MTAKINASRLYSTVRSGTPVRVLIVRESADKLRALGMTREPGLIAANRRTGVMTLVVTAAQMRHVGGYGRTQREYRFLTSEGWTLWHSPVAGFMLAPEDAPAIKRAHVEALKEDAERAESDLRRNDTPTPTPVVASLAADPSHTPDPVTGRIPALEREAPTQRDPREDYFTKGCGADVIRRDAEAIPGRAPRDFVRLTDSVYVAPMGTPEPTGDDLTALRSALGAETGEPRDAALAAIGGCWAGGTLTGKALSHFARGDYPMAYAVAQDQKRLQAEKHPTGDDLTALRSALGAEMLETVQEALRGLESALSSPEHREMVLDAQRAAQRAVRAIGEVFGRKTPEPAPVPAPVGAVVRFRNSPAPVANLYDVIAVSADGPLDREGRSRPYVRLSPRDPRDTREPFWVGVDLVEVVVIPTGSGYDGSMTKTANALSKAARAALTNVGTSRQGARVSAFVPGSVRDELREAGLMGTDQGLTRKGGIIRDIIANQDEAELF